MLGALSRYFRCLNIIQNNGNHLRRCIREDSLVVCPGSEGRRLEGEATAAVNCPLNCGRTETTQRVAPQSVLVLEPDPGPTKLAQIENEFDAGSFRFPARETKTQLVAVMPTDQFFSSRPMPAVDA